MASESTNTSAPRELTKTEIQAILDVFQEYYTRVDEIFDWATAENEGVRPIGVSNEIYACFHHIARGLYEDGDSEFFKTQIHSAKRHLIRGELDCYKIIINIHLRRCAMVEETLSYFRIIEDFNDYVADGLEKLNRVNTLTKELLAKFMEARRAESRGNLEIARECYSECVILTVDHQEAIEEITENKSYLMACRREIRVNKQERKRFWTTIIASIISALLSGTLASIITLWWK